MQAVRSGGNIATVYGSTGFLGRYVVNRLARLGAQVVVPYRGEEKAINHLKVMGDVGQIVPLRYSLRDRESVERAMVHSNIVVNMVGRFYDTRNFGQRTFVDHARALGQQAAEHGGVERLIHLSAVGADPASPSLYLRAAHASEEAVRAHFPSVTILRLAPVLGPEDHVLTHWGKLLRYTGGRFLPLLEPAEASFQPLLFRDFADAFQAVIQNPETAGKVYELGGPRVWRVQEFLEELVLPATDTTLWAFVKVPAAPAEYVPCSLLTNSLIARFTSNTRTKIWTPDRLKYWGSHLVPSKGSLGMADLGLTPSSIEAEAYNSLRQFRTYRP